MIHQIIYTCALAPGVSRDDIRAIAQMSQVRNATTGITGVLLCHQGSVLQVLEGERTAVENIMKKISQDRRITQILVMLSRENATREFPQWTMGFKDVEASETDANLFKLTEQSLHRALPQTLSKEVRTFGRTFARVNGLGNAVA